MHTQDDVHVLTTIAHEASVSILWIKTTRNESTNQEISYCNEQNHQKHKLNLKKCMHSVCTSKVNHIRQNICHIRTYTEREREREREIRVTFASQSRPMRATRKSTRTIIIPITRISLILEPVNEHVSHSCKGSHDTYMYMVQVEACKQYKVTVSVHLSSSTYDD